ncbi:hypothetical protein CBS101457_001629 [Exobasidium rhododendri]|nr:hypothetical protein CBS101457_001629 [Exobasidium rhododendri]
MSSSEISPRHVRPDMVTSAISFLQDAKVQQSSVSQRVSFLESKGLSPDEIDEALRQTGASGAITAGVNGQSNTSHNVYAAQSHQQHQQPIFYSNGGGGGGYMSVPSAQTHHDRDWRDWFIMAVVSGTIGYGVISLARKFLFPHLQPPNQTILEEDRNALTAKYDEVAAQLSALDAETKAVKAGIEEQKESIEKSIKDVEETIVMLRQSDKKRADEMENIKSEVEGMKSSLATMFEKTKEAQTASLSDLQSELKSLKSLLISRNASTGPSSAIPRPYSPYSVNNQHNGTDAINGTSSPSFTPSKPSIPAWQLASSNDAAPPSTSPKIATAEDSKTEGYTVDSSASSSAATVTT